MKLSVLLVEDDVHDLEQFSRLVPDIFKANGFEVDLKAIETFEEALEAIQEPNIRYDLIISDIYKGQHSNRDAAVLNMIAEHRKGRFCPMIVYSSAGCPDEVNLSFFIKWADKGKPGDLESAIHDILELGIPQIAQRLHGELDNAAGIFLWGFLEDNWETLSKEPGMNKDALERIIRRRAALLLSDLTPGQYSAVDSKYGFEYYIYPALERRYFCLGDIVKHRTTGDIRVVMTPHCYLYTQPNQEQPRADFVLTIKTVSVYDVLGEKVDNAKQNQAAQQEKKIRNWTKSPAQTGRSPEGRYWYIPRFLNIPHLYCDFLQIESISYEALEKEFDVIATLLPPYAEALQECFSSFYGSVGIPNIHIPGIMDLIHG